MLVGRFIRASVDLVFFFSYSRQFDLFWDWQLEQGMPLSRISHRTFR